MPLESEPAPQCHTRRVFRSQHCHSCGVCVRRYDQHCWWVNTCIGIENQGLFTLWLLFQMALVLELCVVNLCVDQLLTAAVVGICLVYWSWLLLRQARASLRGITLHELNHRDAPGFEYVDRIEAKYRRRFPNPLCRGWAFLWFEAPNEFNDLALPYNKSIDAEYTYYK